MPKYTIQSHCHINTNRESDTFVGLNCKAGELTINFPLGYHLSENDSDIRKDILLLMRALDLASTAQNGAVNFETQSGKDSIFPLQQYLFVISDYYNRGYYQERETLYRASSHGKIDWRKTIKGQRPYVQENNAVYLNYIVRQTCLKDAGYITEIHKYCVYESFKKVGWLFTTFAPQRPSIPLDKKLFSQILKSKMQQTFNDYSKRLFESMIAIINCTGNISEPNTFRFGTNRFEYVWEKMIDLVYGIKGKEEFFPKTKWITPNGSYSNANLEPDTIMVYKGNIYVLDAKYYKYGRTGRLCDLPESTSINKQITYGEFIAEQEKFAQKFGTNFLVYNAFLMPYDKQNQIWGDSKNYNCIGEAISDWKHNQKKYEHILGILVDVKHLMTLFCHSDTSEIEQLVRCIELSCG